MSMVWPNLGSRTAKEQNRFIIINIIVIITSPPVDVKYCDECVCMSVCLFVCLSLCLHILKTTRQNFTKCFLHVTCDRGLVILRWQCHTLCTFSLVDDVMSHIMEQVGQRIKYTCWYGMVL